MGHLIPEEVTTPSLKVLELFRQYKDKRFLFVEPGGNFGDYLIYKGAYKLANLAGLKYDTLSFIEFQKKHFEDNEIIYIHGGGGFVPWWSGKPMKLLKKLADEYKGYLILGPTTFSEDINYVRTILNECLGENKFKKIILFTREETSYLIVKQCLPRNAELLCDHDTALNLVKTDLVQRKPLKANYDLYAMRNDKESPALQQYDYFRWIDPANNTSTFEEWVAFHLHARKLITNRTHSTILGSILGLETVMLPNSYHKNRSVWEYSLRQRGVEWKESIECGYWNHYIEKHQILRRIFISYKFRLLLKYRLKILGF